MFKTTFISIMFACTALFAQNPSANSSLCGKVVDHITKEALPFVNIALYGSDSTFITGATSDIDGNFCMNYLRPAKYKIVTTYVGCAKQEIRNVIVNANQKTTITIHLIEKSITLQEVNIVTYQTPECNTISLCKISRLPSLSGVIHARGGRSYARNSARAGRRSEKRLAKFNSSQNKNMVPKLQVQRSLFDRIFGGNKNEEFNTEEYAKIDDNGFKEVNKEPLSTMSIDVDRASYSNVRRFITKGSLPPADAVRVEEMINYFSYNYPQPKNDVPFSITTEYTECAWNKKHNLIHIGIKGRELKKENIPANNLVFLVDVSGSMSDPDKLPLVKSGLRLLVEQLREQDKVSMVVYAGSAGMVLPPTSGANKEKIMEAIENLDAGGSTAGGEGILLAYKTAKENFIASGNNRVILATDGDFNVGVSDDGSLVRLIEEKREDGIFLTVLGFGTGNYKDRKMEQLADKGNGNYAYIDDILEAKKVLVKEMGGTLLTIAKDVKIQIEFNPSKVKAYRLVGYENRLLNKEDFNDDKKDAGELGAGHTVTAIYEIIPAGSDEAVASVDPLKYQLVSNSDKALSDEIMTIKFRYKEPKERKSKLITEVVTDIKKPFESMSENCKFSSAVAQFGMLLRDSKFKGEADYKSVITLAKQSKGEDEEGYRAEFIRLVEMAELLKR